MSRSVSDVVERKLFAESMGKCMNPDCKVDIFKSNGDIAEKAHLVPYCDSKDNSFENLVVLCPNCHTNFDKNSAFTLEQVKMWKALRSKEIEKIFCVKYKSFDELSAALTPLLSENKSIYEEYYLNDRKEMWDVFEPKIISNNGIIRRILENNLGLVQSHVNKDYSNYELVRKYLMHINEFECTRGREDKIRSVLFPKEINSIFGISPVVESFLPSVESVEALITRFQANDEFVTVELGNDNPYILIVKNGKYEEIYLKDAPRLRQLYFINNCFRKTEVRLDSLNFAMKYLNSRRIRYQIIDYTNLKEILINGVKIIFIYEYCLSKIELMRLAPEPKNIVVNLHNWNGVGCISGEAYELAEKFEITLLTMDDFYVYANKLKTNN